MARACGNLNILLKKCFALQRRALFPHLNVQKWPEHVVILNMCTQNVLRATTACTFSTSQLPKVARACGTFKHLYSKRASHHNRVHFFHISTSKSGPSMWYFEHLYSKCASRHNGVHFFDIATSKSGPIPRSFVHVDFDMYFAPQPRGLFPRLNFQK